MSRVVALLVAIAPAACVGAPTSNSRASEIAEARAVSRSIDRYISAHPLQARYFANIADARAKTDRWREFTTLKLIENPNFYDKAIVWARRGRTAQVDFTTSSPSGDWLRRDSYSFRADGTLAKLDSTLSTFHTGGNGLLRVLQVRHYNRAGRVLKATKEFRDAKYLRVRARGYHKNETPVYLRVSRLPFHALLRKPGQKRRR